MVDPMYPVGTKVSMRFENLWMWHNGVVTKSDMFGYWYDIALEQVETETERHPIYEKVWHERVKRRNLDDLR
jgi:hypothetical protein